MISEILACLVGVIAGIFTGLAPGIHTNTVGAVILGFSSFFLGYFSPLTLVVFIVALAISHTFLDFIPSVFLGAPDEDSALSVLPGHDLMIKGEGHKAVILTAYGGISAIVLVLILTPLFILFLPKIYEYLDKVIFLILITASVFLFVTEKKSKPIAVIVFLLSGFLGIGTFNLGLKEPFLPLLTGLFGASSLILSISKKQKIPKQKISKLTINKKILFKPLFASILASPLCSFLPGLGSGQAAVISSNIIGELTREEFLILLGNINTLVSGLGFVSLYAIQKTRSGAAVVIQEILGKITFNQLLIILGVIFVSGILSFFITIYISKFFARNISKVNYSKMSIFILLLLLGVVFFFSGFLGVLVFVIGMFVGLFAILTGVKRIHLMGCLLVPSILFYLMR